MSLVAIKSKYQIVIPAKVRKAAGLEVGDFLEAGFERGKITLAPKVVVDPKHLAKLPEGIREGLEDVRMGRTHGPFYTHGAMMRFLNASARAHRARRRR